MHRTVRLLWLLIFLLAACTPTPGSVNSQTSVEKPATSVPLPLQPTTKAVEDMPAAAPTPADIRPPSTAAEPSPTPDEPALCTPLQDIPFEALDGMISNPYHPPRPGYDDPHAGIDLSVNLNGSQVAVPGHPVQAAMAGRVAMVTANRFPFGNALIIETPLENLPAGWQTDAEVPAPAPTLEPRSALTCPPYPNLPGADNSQRSVYTLYAHLRDAPAWTLGAEVTCGQEIGHIGDSGNALNPHLHYETRAGPSGIQLPAIAHYDSSATSEEMSAYCLWSVSGVFQLIDPQRALGIHPAGQ